MKPNRPRIVIYSSGSTVLQYDRLRFADGLKFSSQYPGGKSRACSFFIPADPRRYFPVQVGQRVKVYNGFKVVWDGRIRQVSPTVGTNGRGFSVQCLGHWGYTLAAQKIVKPWADMRIDQGTWEEDPTSAPTKFEKFQLDRLNRLRIVPKAGTFTTNERYGVAYIGLPTGQTIKRVAFNYDFQEAAQNWRMRLRDSANAVDLWNVTTSGTGSQDITLGTPSTSIRFIMDSLANQTAPGDETIYAEASSVTVYTETGAINAQEITKDLRALTSELSTSEQGIGALTVSLVPYVVDRFTSYADILEEVTSFGGASFEPWAVYLANAMELVDDKPMLVLEAQPALTAADYVVDMAGGQISSLSFTQAVDQIWNWIAVEYQDENRNSVTLTPDDDASLKDDASIALYGKRVYPLRMPMSSSSTMALQYGKAYLAKYKDLQWKVNGTIPITGYISGVYGEQIPACEIEAGKRVKIKNFLNDLSGDGLTQLITGVDYNHSNQTATLTCGVPDSLDVWLNRKIKELGK